MIYSANYILPHTKEGKGEISVDYLHVDFDLFTAFLMNENVLEDVYANYMFAGFLIDKENGKKICENS